MWRGRAPGRITAPLVLERTREGWKVVDFALNGRRVPFLPGREHAFLDGTRHVPGGSTERVVAAWDVSRATLTPTLDVDLRLTFAGAPKPEAVQLSLPFSSLPEPSVPAWQQLRQPVA